METIETLIVFSTVIGATAWLVIRTMRSLNKAAGCEGCSGCSPSGAKSAPQTGTNDLVTLRIRKANRER
jgi:FeoB-associated Cys-rich membrane protein